MYNILGQEGEVVLLETSFDRLRPRTMKRKRNPAGGDDDDAQSHPRRVRERCESDGAWNGECEPRSEECTRAAETRGVEVQTGFEDEDGDSRHNPRSRMSAQQTRMPQPRNSGTKIKNRAEVVIVLRSRQDTSRTKSPDDSKFDARAQRSEAVSAPLARRAGRGNPRGIMRDVEAGSENGGGQQQEGDGNGDRDHEGPLNDEELLREAQASRDRGMEEMANSSSESQKTMMDALKGIRADIGSLLALAKLTCSAQKRREGPLGFGLWAGYESRECKLMDCAGGWNLFMAYGMSHNNCTSM
ncbi:hypothetical protein FA15DRAFT_660515 [Coprinopsis marcescibilis]|uniref:Uncharacterized protein n=1 Tax=Coprinopsis marcescibilis TaxID=230819 RepID=A0A5C3KFR3_COPMA|nr:hypothetical protein FA15DRAFT_660515 [Coprinopsis marcescibilis]